MEENNSPDVSAMRRELNVIRPKEAFDKITDDEKFQRWRIYPSEVKEEMSKEVFNLLQNQHQLESEQ